MADRITAVVNDVLGQDSNAGPLSREEVLQLIDSGGSEGGAQVRVWPVQARFLFGQSCGRPGGHS